MIADGARVVDVGVILGTSDINFDVGALVCAAVGGLGAGVTTGIPDGSKLLDDGVILGTSDINFGVGAGDTVLLFWYAIGQ
jgi:hypothetical protein